MRICLYTETALPKLGGQELVIDALARQFTELGHEVVVLAQNPRRKYRMDDARLPYPVARHPRFLSTRRLVGWYRRWLIKLHQRKAFDVLHCHSVYPCGYLAALSRGRLNLPILITSHGGDVWEGKSRLGDPEMRRRYVLALESADALVAISRFTAEGFRRLCPDTSRIVDIPNGVELGQFTQQAARPADLAADIRPGEYLLFLGRLHRRKGVDVLLEALARPEAATARLVIAGDGDERGPLEAMTRQLGLADRVRFVGSVRGANKSYLLQNSRGLVVPSRDWESFGLVVLESYASGRPVVASNLPGLADLIQVGVTGYLAAPESSEDLAQALAKLHADAEATKRMGEAASRFVQAFSWRAIAERHVELYERLMAERRDRCRWAAVPG
jgi:teichuronic acid biosynthesis glycosyltransferase TuaC